MIRVGAIIASVFFVGSALGQAEMWWALRSSQNAQQREAIRAAVDEFSAKIQAALSMTGDDNIEADGVADVYPTEKTAVEAMVDAFAARAKASPAFDLRRTRIILATLPPERSGVAPLPDGNVGVAGSWSAGGSSGTIGQAATTKAQEQAIVFAWSRFRRMLPGVKIYAGAAPQTAAPDEMVLGLAFGEVTQIVAQAGPVWAHGFQGKLVGVCMIGDSKTRFQTRFGIQQWADSSTEFFQQQPSKRWIIAHSTTLFPSADEALRNACDQAADQFATQMRGRTQRYTGSPMAFDSLKSLAFAHFVNGGTTDRLVQRYATPAGSSFRASVLVSSSDSTLQRILPADQVVYQNDRLIGRSSSSLTGRNALIMLLVIVAMACILKRATRGPPSSIRPLLAFMLALAIGALVVALFSARVVSTPQPRAVMIR